MLAVTAEESSPPLANPLLGVSGAGTLVQRELPVAARGDAPVPLPLECVTGFELVHVHERGPRSGDESELEERVEGFPVEFARRQAGGMQRLQLGRERDPPGSGDHIEWLDSEPIPRE